MTAQTAQTYMVNRHATEAARKAAFKHFAEAIADLKEIGVTEEDSLAAVRFAYEFGESRG